MVDYLDDYEEAEMDANFKKMQLWQAKKMAKAAAERQGTLEAEGIKEAAEMFGLTPDEARTKLMELTDPDEIEESERLFKDGVKRYVSERLSRKMEKKSERGNPLQDSRGRFTSKEKLASEKVYAQKVAEMKERVSRGGRLSEDELLEIMPRLR